MWTKRQVIADAFGELALAGFDFDLTPEEMQSAVRALDLMMVTWQGNGIACGYVFALTPDQGDLDEDCGAPLNAVAAMVPSLAIRIAASKGKAVPASLKATAHAAYSALQSTIAAQSVRPQQLRGGTPLGSGNRWHWHAPAFATPPNTDPLQTDAGGDLTFS